jgi:hypothetical protein
MPRGRQYYDPIVQAPSKVKSASSRRIELYPEQDVRDNAVTLRWVGRLVSDEGVIIEKAQGSFDHDDALRQAQELWPGLEVFELREESEDSTWEGMGPSPRLWQNRQEVVPPAVGAIAETTLRAFQENPEQVMAEVSRMLHAFSVGQPGTYVRLDDIFEVLESYAEQYDAENNPSAAVGLREAAKALREAF